LNIGLNVIGTYKSPKKVSEVKNPSDRRAAGKKKGDCQGGGREATICCFITGEGENWEARIVKRGNWLPAEVNRAHEGIKGKGAGTGLICCGRGCAHG